MERPTMWMSIHFGGGMSKAKQVMDLTREYLALEVQKTAIDKQMEALWAKLEDLTGESSDSVPVVAKPKKPAQAEQPHAKGTIAKTGMVAKILAYMKSHPGEEFSPAKIATALGMPEKKSLASTCLFRLSEAKEIQRLRRAHFVFPPV